MADWDVLPETKELAKPTSKSIRLAALPSPVRSLGKRRPLGHVIFAAPRLETAAWVLDAPGHKEDGRAVPEKFHSEIHRTGTIQLPVGTFGVVQDVPAAGLEPTWILDAPGHKEDGHAVPEQFVSAIAISERRGCLNLPAGRFIVMRPPASSCSSMRRRVKFNAEAEVVQVAPKVDEPTWVFISPGFVEHSRPVPAPFLKDIVPTTTLPRLALQAGFFTVALEPDQQEGGGDQDDDIEAGYSAAKEGITVAGAGSPMSWVFVAPGHSLDGELVALEHIPEIVTDAQAGLLDLPGGTFTVVLQLPCKSRPRQTYKTCGARLPLTRTMSEILEIRPIISERSSRTRASSAPPMRSLSAWVGMAAHSRLDQCMLPVDSLSIAVCSA